MAEKTAKKISTSDIAELILQTKGVSVHGFSEDVSYDYFIPVKDSDQNSTRDRISKTLGKLHRKDALEEVLMVVEKRINNGVSREEDKNYENIRIMFYKKGGIEEDLDVIRIGSGW